MKMLNEDGYNTHIALFHILGLFYACKKIFQALVIQ